MKHIDADKLIAEIERYKQGAAIARFDNAGENADYFQGKVDLCDDLTHIITSLQQEKPEVDLELEIERIVKNEEKFMKFQVRHQLIGYIARHFYELGLNARKK